MTSEITDKTNLYDYPLILIKFTEKYMGKNVPMNVRYCNEIWNSLTEEEKATNKDYTVWKQNTVFGVDIVIKKDDEIVCEFTLGLGE